MRLALLLASVRAHGRPRTVVIARVRGGIVRRFLRNETGAAMAEYALLIAVIALVAFVGARRLGVTMRDGANYVATVFG